MPKRHFERHMGVVASFFFSSAWWLVSSLVGTRPPTWILAFLFISFLGKGLQIASSNFLSKIIVNRRQRGEGRSGHKGCADLHTSFRRRFGLHLLLVAPWAGHSCCARLSGDERLQTNANSTSNLAYLNSPNGSTETLSFLIQNFLV
jgi:hypothetical protein